MGLALLGTHTGGEPCPHPSLLQPPLMPSFSFLEDNLSHRPLASYRSGETFTQDVRPEQLLEGKVRAPAPQKYVSDLGRG